jgi:hypothetical protein
MVMCGKLQWPGARLPFMSFVTGTAAGGKVARLKAKSRRRASPLLQARRRALMELFPAGDVMLDARLSNRFVIWRIA